MWLKIPKVYIKVYAVKSLPPTLYPGHVCPKAISVLNILPEIFYVYVSKNLHIIAALSILYKW